jgi:hypothetical protein
MSWQRMVNAGLNAFGLMAFIKSLDREDCARFAETVESPTEGCKNKTWVIRMERNDAAPLRVQIKDGWHGAGKQGTLLGASIMVGQAWAPVLWDDEEDPDWFKAAGLEMLDGVA